MSGWLVEHIPAGVLLIALIVLLAGGALRAQRFVRRRYPHLAGEEHNDVTRFAYGRIVPATPIRRRSLVRCPE